MSVIITNISKSCKSVSVCVNYVNNSHLTWYARNILSNQWKTTTIGLYDVYTLSSVFVPSLKIVNHLQTFEKGYRRHLALMGGIKWGLSEIVADNFLQTRTHVHKLLCTHTQQGSVVVVVQGENDSYDFLVQFSCVCDLHQGLFDDNFNHRGSSIACRDWFHLLCTTHLSVCVPCTTMMTISHIRMCTVWLPTPKNRLRTIFQSISTALDHLEWTSSGCFLHWIRLHRTRKYSTHWWWCSTMTEWKEKIEKFRWKNPHRRTHTRTHTHSQCDVGS